MVDQVGFRLERFGLERQWCCTVKKHCTQAIINCAEYALGLPVLLGGVWAREPELDAEVGQKETHGMRVILLAIVCLESEQREAKLGVNIGDERTNSRENIRLVEQRNCP